MNVFDSSIIKSITGKNTDVITFYNLPKVSLNKLYEGTHWSYRKKIKDTYHLLIRTKIKKQYPKTNKYRCSYKFTFKNNPLDATNCAAMIKMIEDVLFEDDKYNLIEIDGISSSKGQRDSVVITIKILSHDRK